jgi:hypothetical protein
LFDWSALMTPQKASLDSLRTLLFSVTLGIYHCGLSPPALLTRCSKPVFVNV